MNLLDYNKAIMGKEFIGAAPSEPRYFIDKDKLTYFKFIFSIHDSFEALLRECDSHKVFYNKCDFISRMVPDEAKEEVFYTMKLGYFVEGIPSKLIYLVKKAKETYDTPNVAINYINKTELRKYLYEGALKNGLTVLDVFNNIYGYPVQLLTNICLKAKNGNAYEFFIKDKEEVCVVPEDIANAIPSMSDVGSLNYVKDVGVCVGDIPIRILADKCGIIFNEFDLRKGL